MPLPAILLGVGLGVAGAALYRSVRDEIDMSGVTNDEFYDLLQADDEIIGAIVHNVELGTIARALTGATREMRQRFLSSADKDTSERLRILMDGCSWIRRDAVERSREEIVTFVRGFKAKMDVR